MNKIYLGCASCLLFVLFLLDITSIQNNSVTYDEPKHFDYGFNILLGNSESLKGIDSAMPFTALNGIAKRLAYELPDSNLRSKLARLETGRYVTIIFALILALFIFRWGLALYGGLAACFSLFLFAFEPNLIAHSRFVTTDLYAAAMTSISLYFFWRFFKNGFRWTDGIYAAASLGLSQLAKYTCLFLYPIFLLIVLLKFCRQPKRTTEMVSKLQRFFLWSTIFVLINLFVINAGYLFHQSFKPLSQYSFQSNLFQKVQLHTSFLKNIPVPLPFPYLRSLDHSLFNESTGQFSARVYMLGQLRDLRKGDSPFPGYFLICALFKVPIAIQVFFVFSLFSYFLNYSKRRFSFWDDEIFLFVPIVFFTIYLNFFFRAQIGIRYFLIIFPLGLLFCGNFLKHQNLRSLSNKMKIFLLGGAIYLVVSVLSYFPHYLSYFNEWVWQRKKAYTILSDSNIDWGQNIWNLQEYLKDYPESTVDPKGPTSGRVIVTVNALTGVFWATPQKHAWLRDHFQPVDHVGYSYLVYDISPEDLKKYSIH